MLNEEQRGEKKKNEEVHRNVVYQKIYQYMCNVSTRKRAGGGGGEVLGSGKSRKN